MPRPETALTPADIVTLDRAGVAARLLAGILHDINNSLLVISGTAEILDAEPPEDAPLREGLTRIRERTAAAAAAIHQVLSFARGDPVGREPVDLRAVAARSLEFRAFSMRRARVTSALTAPGDVTIFVEANAVLLVQAILALLSNAEQALAGRPAGRIDVVVAREGDCVSLRVVDSGPGVARDDRDRIFDPFFTTRPRHEASGLGLAAARVIAAEHGGTLTLDDTESGASFALTLPRFDARR